MFDKKFVRYIHIFIFLSLAEEGVKKFSDCGGAGEGGW